VLVCLLFLTLMLIICGGDHSKIFSQIIWKKPSQCLHVCCCCCLFVVVIVVVIVDIVVVVVVIVVVVVVFYFLF